MFNWSFQREENTSFCWPVANYSLQIHASGNIIGPNNDDARSEMPCSPGLELVCYHILDYSFFYGFIIQHTAFNWNIWHFAVLHTHEEQNIIQTYKQRSPSPR